MQVAAKAPLYFKKAVDDAESEWSQHHAKRWMGTSAKVGNTCCPQAAASWDALHDLLLRPDGLHIR